MKNLKKRTFLLLLAGLTATVFASAQKQPLPEWQSQYAVGLNNSLLTLMYGLMPMLPILRSREAMSNLLIICL